MRFSLAIYVQLYPSVIFKNYSLFFFRLCLSNKLNEQVEDSILGLHAIAL